MKHTLLVVSCLSLGLAVAAGCAGATGHAHATVGGRQGASGHNECVSPLVFGDAGSASVQPRLVGAAVDHYNKGYVDGVGAAAFFNKGRPLTGEQVERLIEIGRRQGDPTGLLALDGYSEGYRAGAKHGHNPHAKRMTPEQVAQVNKARGLPVEPGEVKDGRAVEKHETHASAPRGQTLDRGEQRKAKKERRRAARETAEASVRD